MSRVFIVQNPKMRNVNGRLVSKFSFERAKSYGDLVYVLGQNADPFEPNDETINRIHSKLDDYDPDEDYLLLVGNPCLIGFVVAIAADATPRGRVRLLQWSNNDYRVVRACIF